MRGAASGPDLPADAYVWGYPLVTMHRTCAMHGGVGRGLQRRDRLSTAADRTVVAPNNDTLYASGWYDLRAGDLTVDVGAMDRRRYWSVMLLDAYTHVGYVCRRLDGTKGTRVSVTYDPSTPADVNGAAAVLPVGTPRVWVLARVVVDGPDDLDPARTALSLIQVRQNRAATASPVGSAPVSAAGAATRFFPALRDALAIDPPAVWHPPPPPGIEDWLAHLPEGQVLAEGVARGEARIDRSLGVDRRGNGWGTRSRGANFGDDVAYRAAYAKVSLAGHLPAENRSYTRAFDGSVNAQLRFRPGSEPPVDGFWSLCLYGPDLYFVDNEIGRYSIGDRTPGLRRDADGSLTITVGHARPDDSSNWLPAPTGPGFLTLRAYEGHTSIVDARWFPPDLVTVAPSTDQARPTHAH